MPSSFHWSEFSLLHLQVRFIFCGMFNCVKSGAKIFVFKKKEDGKKVSLMSDDTIWWARVTGTKNTLSAVFPGTAFWQKRKKQYVLEFFRCLFFQYCEQHKLLYWHVSKKDWYLKTWIYQTKIKLILIEKKYVLLTILVNQPFNRDHINTELSVCSRSS